MRLITKNIVFCLGLSSILLISGCSSIKQSIGNQSLEYTNAQKLPPIQLPVDAQNQAFTPLYHVPTVGTNTLTIKSKKGKNYQLPKPHPLAN